MGRYIWENKDWPNFTWQSEKLLEALGSARKSQGKVIAQADFIGLEEQADLIVEEAFTTSAIEGEKLDRGSLRSSVARRLGLPTEGLPKETRNGDGLVEMLLDASTNYHQPLNGKRLFGWQAALFPTGYSGLHKVHVGSWRVDDEPMQVISGPIGKEKVHYEAPPSKSLTSEMTSFLNWWKDPRQRGDGLLRAGVAHFWFVTIHPFEDGNGRLARAITDMALAQDEKTSRRLYSLSKQIIQERKSYYNILEQSQKGSCDITEWLLWFLQIFESAVKSSQGVIGKALHIAKYWQKHNQSELNERQIKVINRLLEAEPQGFQGDLTNRKYVGMTKVSRESAKRDLADLEKKGLIKRTDSKGRSVSYVLSI